MKEYIYHGVPTEMRGEVLYPLNHLKSVYPDLFDKENSKYAGRRHVPEQIIPNLNCLWNDVLHFTAVHPKEIKQAFLDLGKEYTFRYYQVDAESIPTKDAVVYLYKQKEGAPKFAPDNFISYDPHKLEMFQTLPEATKQYYKEKIENNERPLMYHRVPHILYGGTLDISDYKIVEV